MATEYQREQARKKARAAGKVPAGDKKKKSLYKSPKTNRQRAQEDITRYKLDSYGKPSSSVQATKASPTATSGGSKSVRKILSGESLVNRLRKKSFKYLK